MHGVRPSFLLFLLALFLLLQHEASCEKVRSLQKTARTNDRSVNGNNINVSIKGCSLNVNVNQNDQNAPSVSIVQTSTTNNGSTTTIIIVTNNHTNNNTNSNNNTNLNNYTNTNNNTASSSITTPITTTPTTTTTTPTTPTPSHSDHQNNMTNTTEPCTNCGPCATRTCPHGFKPDPAANCACSPCFQKTCSFDSRPTSNPCLECVSCLCPSKTTLSGVITLTSNTSVLSCQALFPPLSLALNITIDAFCQPNLSLDTETMMLGLVQEYITDPVAFVQELKNLFEQHTIDIDIDGVQISQILIFASRPPPSYSISSSASAHPASFSALLLFSVFLLHLFLSFRSFETCI